MTHEHDHNCKDDHSFAILSRRKLLQTTALGAGWMLLGRNGEALAQGAPSEIRIGGTISQSGTFQAIVGPFHKLMTTWADRVNAKGGIFLKQYNKSLPIKMFLYDDKSEPATALSFYERLATVDKVDLFIGPFSSFLHNAALQASVTHKVPFFMTEGNDAVLFEKPNPWRVSGLSRAVQEMDKLVDFYAERKGVKTFAILGRDNLHEQGAVQGVAAALKKRGFEVVYQDLAPKDIKDFSSIVLAIKAKNPDVLIAESIAPPWTIQFLKQARELGLNPKDVVPSHGPVPVIKGMGDAAENLVSLLYSFDGDSADHKDFNELCKEAGFEAWAFSEAGIRYRTFKRIEDTLKRAGSVDKEAVRKAMWETNIKIFGSETMKHDSEGYGTDIPYPVQVKSGKYVSLWPISRGVGIHKFKDHKW